MKHPLTTVLDDLAELVGHVPADRAHLPTPCPDYDVGALRTHLLGWLPVFVTALRDPDGSERPDPSAYRAPEGPDAAGAAAAQVRSSAVQVADALAGGVEDRSVRLLGGELPGHAVVGMLTGEVVTHGWDLARATGLPWQPSEAACASALAGLRGMLTPQYRGAGKSFGDEVPVPDDAGPLDRLIAFSGRDPRWSSPALPSPAGGSELPPAR